MTIESAALKIAFCGEVSSGKSTALQCILRKIFIPDYFGSETRPTVRVFLGASNDTKGYYTSAGEYIAADTLEEIEEAEDVAEIALAYTNTFGLGRPCELVEIPPFRDGHVRDNQISMVAECAVMVWTTIGSQAWRLSEKTILDEFGSLLPKKRVLVATRTDKFRSDEDLAKLLKRLENETSSYFSDGHLLGVPASLFATPDDESAWDDAGVTQFVTLLSEIIGAVDVTELDHNAGIEPLPADKTVSRRKPKSRMLTRMNQVLERRAAVPAKPESDDETLEAVTKRLVSNDTPKTEPVAPLIVENEPDELVPAMDQDEGPETIEAATIEEDPLTALISSVQGLIAIGVQDADNPDAVDRIFGEAQSVKVIGKFSAASTVAAAKLAVLEEPGATPESGQIVTDQHCIVFQVEGKKVLFLAGEASHLTAGIAKTLLARLAKLYEENAIPIFKAA